MVESKERWLTFRAEGQPRLDAATPIGERANDPINGLWGLTPSAGNANRASFPTGLPGKIGLASDLVPLRAIMAVTGVLSAFLAAILFRHGPRN